MQPGQSLEPDKVFTLEDLEQQFGETLLEKFRLLFQLFVHRNSAPPGLCWRISQHSEPSDLFMPRMLMDRDSYFNIWTDGSLTRGVRFEAKAYDFAQLLARSRSPPTAEFSEEEREHGINRPAVGALSVMALDETCIDILADVLEEYKALPLSEAEVQELADWLVENAQRGENLRVFLYLHLCEDRVSSEGPKYHCVCLFV